MNCKFKFHMRTNESGKKPASSVDSSVKTCPSVHGKCPLGYLLAGIFLFSFSGMGSVAHSATYYLSPTGSNSQPGTSASPWKTFAFSIPKLQPGDTLFLQDGIYDHSNSGYPTINCTSNAKNGTSANPITIKALNERRAFLNIDGQQTAFRMENCSYWIIEGLRAKSQDKSDTPGAVDVFFVNKSSHLVFKRLLLSHNNRYKNSHLLLLWNSSKILVVESEFYSFQRHAIAAFGTSDSVFRRNYFNSRGRGDIFGGFKSLNKYRGDMGVTVYPGSNNIVENNISEGNVSVADVQSTRQAVGNKFLGNISRRDLYGLVLQSRGTGTKMPVDTIIENHVSISPTHYGIIARGTKNTRIKNVSLFGGSSGIIADFEQTGTGDGVYSIFSKNALVMDHSGYGFSTKFHTSWSHEYPNVYNNEINFNPDTNVLHRTGLNPGFGTCKVFVPHNSSLKGKGAGGEDIGGNILYRYENGVLTNKALWNSPTGEFPHGVRVPGVNDIAGSSVFDVHKRVNVNFNGCSLPDNYGSESDLTPKNLSVLSVTSG